MRPVSVVMILFEADPYRWKSSREVFLRLESASSLRSSMIGVNPATFDLELSKATFISYTFTL
jgi:hypothetical protein